MPSSEPSPALTALARASGVATEYWDWQGNQVIVSAHTISAVLQALGVDTVDDAAVAESLAGVGNRWWRRTLPPIVVCRQGSNKWVPVHLHDGDTVRAWTVLEDGTHRDLAQIDNYINPRTIDDQLIGEATFEIPGDLPLGWHTVSALIGDEMVSPLISALTVCQPSGRSPGISNVASPISWSSIVRGLM